MHGPSLFGVKSRFAVEVGEIWQGPLLRRVDVWAVDRWLTCNDNHVFVPQFIGALKRAISDLLRDPQEYTLGRPFPELSATDNYRRLRAEADAGDNGEYCAYRFMDWGPTADNVSMTLFREGDTASLRFSFPRDDHHELSGLGQVFVAELSTWELAGVLHEAAWSLELAGSNRNESDLL